MGSLKYRGEHNLTRNTDLHRCGHSVKNNALLRRWGSSNSKLARIARFLTGHFPHGEFRSRFKLEGPTECACGHPLETRDHILYDCPLWIHPIKRPRNLSRAFRFALIVEDEDEERYAGHPTLEKIHLFLEQNPMIATFEWADLLQQAADDHQRDRHSLHLSQALLQAHTVLKVSLHRMYCDKYGNDEEFFRKYNPSDVAHKMLQRFRPPPGL
ncbi:hypothetical protein K474DRAFT_1618457 [Panus rudis PR-1116 ss-1]|nr:hypothetical protein K474DRAFT_1618457 [Panus rudis PR-1116 ss-1]